VICLHSSGLSAFQWKRLADKLAESYRFVAPDFLGCGQSPPALTGRDFRYAEELDQVLALLDAEAEPVILLAHSYGGFIALKCALQRLSLVRGLCLYEPVIWGGLASYRGDSIETVVRGFDPDGILLNRELAGSETWMERFVDYWNGPGSWRSMTEAARRPMFAMADKLWAEVKEVVLDPTPHSAYRSLSMPVHILHGTTSPAEVLQMKDILFETVPDCSLARIPGGHMNPVRNPLPVNANFEFFLRRFDPHSG
jgi:pimeloyl-ACP methyl ester carboxylesterase